MKTVSHVDVGIPQLQRLEEPDEILAEFSIRICYADELPHHHVEMKLRSRSAWSAGESVESAEENARVQLLSDLAAVVSALQR